MLFQISSLVLNINNRVIALESYVTPDYIIREQSLLNYYMSLFKQFHSFGPSDMFDIANSIEYTQTLLNDSVAHTFISDKHPTVGIVMPTKDRLYVIRNAIDSVLQQSYSYWKLYIIDDHSTDGTLEILSIEYDDDRICWISSPGHGASAARNAGLTSLTSDREFVAYLYSDNEWTPDYLQVMLCALQKENASCGYAVQELHSYAVAKSGTREKIISYRNTKFDYCALLSDNYIDMNIFVHKLDLFKKLGGFDEKLKRCVDWDLILRYSRNNKTIFVNYIGVHYNNDDHVSRITTTEKQNAINYIHNKHIIDWHYLSTTVAQRELNLCSIIMCITSSDHLCVNTALKNIDFLSSHIYKKLEVIIIDNTQDNDKANMLDEIKQNSGLNITMMRLPMHICSVPFANNLGFAISQGAEVIFLTTKLEDNNNIMLDFQKRKLNKDISPRLTEDNVCFDAAEFIACKGFDCLSDA